MHWQQAGGSTPVLEKYSELYLARENLADSDPVIKPRMVVNRRFIALHRIITKSLSANYSSARCRGDMNYTAMIINRHSGLQQPIQNMTSYHYHRLTCNFQRLKLI